MDLILSMSDNYFFTPYIYPESIPEDNILRQFLSLHLIVLPSGFMLYFLTAIFNYFFIFNRQLMKHPHFLKNQVSLEIQCAVKAIPLMTFFSVLLFIPEVKGYSKLYNNISESSYGWWGLCFNIIFFLMMTDMGIYWIHRFLHHRLFYKRLHKLHHTWKIPTPFASHAFHPVDGFMQSTPYHIYVFLFPMHKITFLILFVFVNIWSVSIHDGDFRVPNFLKPFINGSAHHLDHHTLYCYNYGQFFTLWDRIGGSFRHPSSFEGMGPLNDIVKHEKDKTIKQG